MTGSALRPTGEQSSARDEARVEREVTIVFADLAGFTALAKVAWRPRIARPYASRGMAPASRRTAPQNISVSAT